MMTTYVWHSDPGHGWLAVKLSELVNLGIADQISTYSYIKGSTAYLEEDRDAAVFVRAWEARRGTKISTREGKHWADRCPVRGFERYSAAEVQGRYPHHRVMVTSMMSGKPVEIDSQNLGTVLDPSQERYWSM